MKIRHVYSIGAVIGCILASASSVVQAQPCQVPDNGTGTVTLPPPGCGYLSPADVHEIINGLPAGTTIELGAEHRDFFNISHSPGGSLGGEVENFTSFIRLDLHGTGGLAGYNRVLFITGVQCQTHTAPRTPGTSPQSFNTAMFALQGQLPPGDPDFDLLRITGGTGFGMPSPGHTTLTQLPGGNWNVESFFDIEYRIDFVGAPGGPLAGRSGSTTATIRMSTGQPLGVPCCTPTGQCVQAPTATDCSDQGGTQVSHCPADGRCIPPGNDCFYTECGRTQVDFCNDPIPADFFGPGSLPFDGLIRLGKGTPGGGDISTIVHRSRAMLLDGPPETIPIELVQLNLVSCQPIVVQTGTTSSQWNVQVNLSPLVSAPQGSMTAAKTHANGGTFDAQLFVQPVFIFTNVQNPSDVRILDTGAEGTPPVLLDTVGTEPWVYQSPLQPNPCGVNFVPGVQQNPQTLEQCCTETCHANPAGGHEHCTKQCSVCPSGACCDPTTNSCTVVDGGTCGGVYKGDGTNCDDSDGDGLADWFENNDCCQRSTPCNSASSPTDPDSDDDGVLDGAELAQGCDPCVPDCGATGCCLPSGACVNGMPQTACQAQGGIALPAGVVCQGDVNGDGIDEACYSPPCVECGPGLHWIHTPACPPGGQGQDTMPSGAVLGIDTDLDCVADINVIAGGPVSIRKRGPFDDASSFPGTRPVDGHLDVIDTEMVAMTLMGGGVVVKAGTLSGSANSLAPTLGAIAEQPGNPAQADSFFDVFVEIQSGTSLYYNQMPIQVAQVITCLPPDSNYYHLSGCTPLYTSPIPGQGVHVANLVAANHFTYPACCSTTFPLGCANNIPTTQCQAMGGTPVASCTGDNDGNGIDDACEPVCEVDPGSPTGCTNACPGPTGQQCLPSAYGCLGGGQCGVIDCDCTCRLEFGATGPFCTGPCPVPPGGNCQLYGDGSIGNAYRCECGGSTPCQPNASGTDCEPALCPGPVPPAEKCLKKCAKVDAVGNVIVTDCECDGDSVCHMTLPAAGNVAGGPNGCVVAGNGGGTVTLPPAGCDYLSPAQVHMIVNGLPAGTTIELAPIHKDFICHDQPGAPTVCTFPLGVDCEEPGGSLGGDKECRDSTLQLHMTGHCVGAPNPICGMNRVLNLPLSFETHTGPRTPGDPVQSFDTDMFRMFGQIMNPGSGDPDFDLLRITAGTDFGMPSPGHTTLTKLPGGPNWAVDSFFDITYRIDFVGRPGGILGGMSGSTTGTIRMATSAPFSCDGTYCPVAGQTCAETWVPQADGTVKVCCDCAQIDPTGVCCTSNAVGNACINTTQSQCQGTFLPGATCSGIMVACCLPNGVCTTMDEVCCQAAGGTSHTTTTCTGPQACCFTTGSCQMLDPLCCVDLGGTPGGAGSTCVDADGNAVADVCERCEPNSTGTGCTQPLCPVGPPVPETCQKRCGRYDPLTGQITITDCDCRGTSECHLASGPNPNVAGGPGADCIEPDAGGTVVLPPPGCGYVSPDDFHEIIAGLPPGTTVQVGIEHQRFVNIVNTPGGALGGEKETFNSDLKLTMNGACTGPPNPICGYSRVLNIQTMCETHIGPRMPGSPTQSFDTDMFMIQGQLPPGDPDFDLLRITAGTGFGLPSPGHTTLTKLPGSPNWAVDSFFDITYRIDFVGAPGGPFAGRSGSTTGTIRMATHAPFKCVGGCLTSNKVCTPRVKSVPGTNLLDVCCDCRPKKPITDGTGINKARFISLALDTPAVAGLAEETALRVRLVSLHHVDPPYTGGSSIPFTAFEGEEVWVGPPAVYLESVSSGIRFVASQLQCDPYYRDWTSFMSCSGRPQLCKVDTDCDPMGGTCTVPVNALLHVTGLAVVPSSIFDVEVLGASCMGSESTCADVSDPLTLNTGRWGDIVVPFSPPPTTTQPDTADISSLVNKFRSAVGAPIKARALLAGSNASGLIDLAPDLSFVHISACVDAFKGSPFPYKPGHCTGGRRVCGADDDCTGSTCVGGFNPGATCVMQSQCTGTGVCTPNVAPCVLCP